MASQSAKSKMGKQFGVAIPTYRDRRRWIFKTLQYCNQCNNIADVAIVDDHSDFRDYQKLEMCVRSAGSKSHLHRNSKNLFMLKNKIQAMRASRSEYVALIDSDNIIDCDYVNPVLNKEWRTDVVFQPSHLDCFDFEEFAGLDITAANARDYLGIPMFRVMINACNHFAHRDSWLRAVEVWDFEPGVHDSLFINYSLLKAGMTIRVVPGMRYKHAVHDQSTYKLFCGKMADMSECLYSKIGVL